MINANVLVWDDDQRRVGSVGAFAAAVIVVLGALAAWWFASATPAWLYWVLVGLLVLVLAFMAVLLFVPARSAEAAPAAEAAHVASEHDHEAPEAPHDAPEEHAPPAPVPASDEPRVLTLRCGDCGTIFDVTDTGERPLYHTCPGCGAEGALRDPVAEEGEPEAGPASAPVPVPVPAPEPAPAPAVKKLKLRCGGCKEVFTIEDTGERPLKRGCPHCGRMGQIS